mgnify:FL=1
MKKVTNSKKDLDDLKSQLARILADYDNLRKRTDEERETWIKFSTQRVIVKLIPILDALESAQDHLKDQGLGIAINEFKKVVSEEEIEEVKPEVGSMFDESVSEVVESVEGEDKGKIAEVVLNGWKYKDGRVLRYARVKVYGDKEFEEKKEELDKEMARGEHI